MGSSSVTESRVDCRLETEHTSLRRLTDDDAQALFEAVGDPEVMRYWFPGPDADVAATAERIAEIERHWHTHGFGLWGVVSKLDGELIGFAGLHHIADMDEVNIGYVLRRDRWRQGLGQEIAECLLTRAFDRLRLHEVVAVLDPENTASVRLAVKSGLAERRRFRWMGRDRLCYGISSQEWAASRSVGCHQARRSR